MKNNLWKNDEFIKNKLLKNDKIIIIIGCLNFPKV